MLERKSCSYGSAARARCTGHEGASLSQPAVSRSQSHVKTPGLWRRFSVCPAHVLMDGVDLSL